MEDGIFQEHSSMNDELLNKMRETGFDACSVDEIQTLNDELAEIITRAVEASREASLDEVVRDCEAVFPTCLDDDLFSTAPTKEIPRR